MKDYQPLDLTPFYNVGTSFISETAQPPIGNQTFHGLPFEIGSDAARCFMGFAVEDGLHPVPISVPIGTTARHVIFAHALLESKIDSGENIGYVVASYVFRFASGEEIRVPIRERFEIACVPTGWGQLAFLAVPDMQNRLQPRYEGPWGAAGNRQTEVIQAWPRQYFLWAWENPHPERVMESVTIEPADRKFLVAAITLGHVEEHPFVRTGSREVVITLPQAEDAQKPFKLEVEVDRGTATYPFPLPQQSAEEFIADAKKGWGEAQNPTSSPAYVEIAAIPSATVTVKNDGEELGKVNWGELQEKKQVATERVHLRVLERGKNWVHVTVLDDETGKPIPCRVHFRSPEGIPYQPHGHHNHVNSNLGTWHIDIGGDLRLGQITYAYIDGKCQGWLPRGEVIVDVARGF
ncbi:MAG: hypothetical protein NZT92_19350, partial [Abditibacteriales bacterium]|nr:hypothetical protein [Abditibacteriales bacterium]